MDATQDGMQRDEGIYHFLSPRCFTRLVGKKIMFWGSKPLSLSGESAYGEYAWGRIRMWERTHVRERMGERLSGESTFGVRARRSVARLVQDQSF